MALGRSAFRIALEGGWAADPVTSAEIVGYQDCVVSYEALARDGEAAQRELIETVRPPRGRRERTPETAVVESWRLQTVAVPGLEVPAQVVHRVRLETQNGLLTREMRRESDWVDAVSTRSYLLVRPDRAPSGGIRFSGMLDGYVAFEEDAPAMLGLKAGDVYPRSFDSIEQQVRKELTEGARTAVLQRYAKGYMAAANADTYVPSDSGEGSHKEPKITSYDWQSKAKGVLKDENPKYSDSRHRELITLLVDRPQTPEQALNHLERAFNPNSNPDAAIKLLLDADSKALEAWLPAYDLVNRYNWFMQNLVTIRRELNLGIRDTITRSFGDAFEEQLRTERAKVVRLQGLAAAVRGTEDVTSCRPQVPATES